MHDIIRKTLYTGVGAAVLANAKFKEFVEELIQNNELTKEEGQRVILKAIHLAEDKKSEVETQLYKTIDGVLMALKLPARNELEIKYHDFLSSLKNKNIGAFFKQKTDHTPTTR